MTTLSKLKLNQFAKEEIEKKDLQNIQGGHDCNYEDPYDIYDYWPIFSSYNHKG